MPVCAGAPVMVAALPNAPQTPLVSVACVRTSVLEVMPDCASVQSVRASVHDPDEFAGLCYKMHEDRSTWEWLREGGLRAVARDCSPEQFHRAVKQAISSLLKLDAEAQPEVPAPLKLVA